MKKQCQSFWGYFDLPTTVKMSGHKEPKDDIINTGLKLLIIAYFSNTSTILAMKYLLMFTAFLISTLTYCQNITGNWEGAAEVNGTELPIIFHITKDDTGKYSATFDSPKQQAFGIACSGVLQKEDSVIISIAIIKGTYSGKLTTDGLQLKGNMNQGGASLPLNLAKTGNVATKNKPIRPQTPKPPYPYKSEDVVYSNADKSIEFGATFTVPLPEPGVDYFRAPIYPTVILITGSGPEDRDETMFDHKPFAVIADYLTRHGIAVLRVDDRGVGKTTGNFSTATTADFANDVEAGIEYLKTRQDVDINHIGLIGHSEGGIIAPMLAAKRKDIKFIVMLAGPGINMMDMMGQQSADVMLSTGITKADVDLYTPLYKSIVTSILNAKDSASASKKTIEIFKQWQKDKTASTIKNTTAVENEKGIINFTNTFIKQLSSPWLKYFMKINPADYLTKVNCAVLALNGEKDIQVAAKPNLASIKAALEKNKNTNFKTMEIQGLNHLFQHCKTCTVEEYGQLEETFAPEVLPIIAEWIKAESIK